MPYKLRLPTYLGWMVSAGIVTVFLWDLVTNGFSWLAAIGYPAGGLLLYSVFRAIYAYNTRLVLANDALTVRRGGDPRLMLFRKGEGQFFSTRATVNYRDILAVRVAEDGWVEVDVDPATGVPEEMQTIAIPARDPAAVVTELERRVERAKHAVIA